MDKGINILHRKSIRLKNYNYTQSGYYFVTICTHNHKPVFLNEEFKSIVREEWHNTAIVRDYIVLDEFVVMPNHIHGIIIIRGNRRGQAAPDPNSGNRININKEMSDPNTNNTINKTVPDPNANNCTINKRATHRIAPTIHPNSLGSIIGQFKSLVTKRINRLRNTPGVPVWQRNYYEHIIRNEKELNEIRDYIIHNPTNWNKDKYNPKNLEMQEKNG